MQLESKSEGYQIYITENNIEYQVIAFENSCAGLIFPLDFGEQTPLCHPFVIMDNKMLSEVVFDYAAHHIPAYHALSHEKALQFLDELIEELGKQVSGE